MATVKWWCAFALTLFALGAVWVAGTPRSWATYDEATKDEEVAKPDAGTQNQNGADTKQSSDAENTPATDSAVPTTDNQATDENQ